MDIGLLVERRRDNFGKEKENTMYKLNNLIIFIFLIISCCSNVFAQEDRGARIVYRDRDPERRTAIVIGNGNYKTSPLRNPCNDAQDISEVLQQKNFQVTLLLDADKRQMVDAIRQFGKKLKLGGVGLFYYAGHGMQVNGRNYLIPVGASIEAEHEIPLESVDVNLILGYMEDAENRLNIVILDACRDNPFSRSFRSSAKGLAQIDAPIGTLIAYATSPGATAADGTGRNGIYTKHLLEQIKVPKLELGQMFRRVRTGVRKETGGKQVSWESVSIEGSFYFTHEFSSGENLKDSKDIDLDSIYNEQNWEVLKGGWDFSNKSITSKFTSEDSYLILNKELKDYIMEATVTKIRGGTSYITIGIRQSVFGGGHEMLFRNHTSSRQGYQFGILLDGRYNLFNGINGRYYTIENASGLFKKNWETSPLIDNIKNKIRIEVIADNVKISINGKEFVKFKDSSHLYGSPMLIVSKNNQIRFTDIIIKGIKSHF